jgi:3-hydroxyacyl-[acyl-carrier-protein] dehydratase
MAVDAGVIQEVLDLVPGQVPFRFIDEIISLDEEEIIGAYRFREDEFFYRGNFPGCPITPG